MQAKCTAQSELIHTEAPTASFEAVASVTQSIIARAQETLLLSIGSILNGAPLFKILSRCEEVAMHANCVQHCHDTWNRGTHAFWDHDFWDHNGIDSKRSWATWCATPCCRSMLFRVACMKLPRQEQHDAQPYLHIANLHD